MSLRNGNGDSLRRYLLGELSEQEREQVEQRLMVDDELYEGLLLAEDDLIDAYVSGSLSEQERAKFSRRFLHVPELGQDVRSVRALRRYALETAPQPAAREAPRDARRSSLLGWLRKFFMRPAVGVAFAVAALAALALAAWLASQNSQLRKQVGQLQAQQSPTPAAESELREQLAAERRRNEQLSAELLRQQELLAEERRKLQEAQGEQSPAPTPTPGSGSAPVHVFAALSPGGVRESGELKKIPLRPDAREVRIRLDLAAADYRAYRAVLQTVDGRELLSTRASRPGKQMFVQLSIPARLLSPGDYQIRLRGVSPSGEIEELDSYYFRVSN